MQPLTIDHITIEYYKHPFKRPFSINGVSLSIREGYYLTLTSSKFKAIAEASPLDGYSFETLKKAHHDLKRFKESLLHQHLPLEKQALFAFLKSALEGCSASAKFAYESACIDLAAQVNDNSIEGFLGISARLHDGVALLQGNHQQVLTQARDFAKQGYRIFKLKVGDRNIPLDVAKVQEIRACLPQEGKIRLDANRFWKLSEAVLFVQLIGKDNIEFIEEPLADLSQLASFYQQTLFPVALDETLLTSRCDVTAPGRCMPTLVNQDAVHFFVIKPTLLGGVIKALDWVEYAKKTGKRALISSMFETPIGMRMLKALSQLTDDAPGFGTESWLT